MKIFSYVKNLCHAVNDKSFKGENFSLFRDKLETKLIPIAIPTIAVYVLVCKTFCANPVNYENLVLEHLIWPC